MPSRALAAVTGLLWIAYGAIRLTEPAYWAPVTPLDHAAVVLFSAAMLGLGLFFGRSRATVPSGSPHALRL